MAVWFLIETAFVFLAAVLLITQIGIPAVMKRPWFPWFRKPRRQAEREVAQAYEGRDLRELQQEAKDVKNPPKQKGKSA